MTPAPPAQPRPRPASRVLPSRLGGRVPPDRPGARRSVLAVGDVHGLGVDPADGVLYLATHRGVLRVAGQQLTPVPGPRRDTEGFTVAGPRHFLASGHPTSPGPGRPTRPGLVETQDAASTWTGLSPAGDPDLDLHSLEQGVDALYGYDARTGTVPRSRDRRR